MHKLRGHHLICLHFFKGEGYDEGFVENIRRVLATIDIAEVVEGLDDVCGACPHNFGFCNYYESSEEEVRELDEFALSLLGLKVGERVRWEDLKAKISEVLEEWKSFACEDCDWRVVCDA
ncbi:MAG: DUF1284 domain-containing protein [Archaeoglobaceae archaeon]